jgi:hypothetical protein
MKSPTSWVILVGAATVSILILPAATVLADSCAALKATHPDIEVVLPGVKAFGESQSEFWSKGCGQLTPSCLILPKSTQQVVNIMHVLGQNNESFAVKGGGHMPNKKFAR